MSFKGRLSWFWRKSSKKKSSQDSQAIHIETVDTKDDNTEDQFLQKYKVSPQITSEKDKQFSGCDSKSEKNGSTLMDNSITKDKSVLENGTDISGSEKTIEITSPDIEASLENIVTRAVKSDVDNIVKNTLLDSGTSSENSITCAVTSDEEKLAEKAPLDGGTSSENNMISAVKNNEENVIDNRPTSLDDGTSSENNMTCAVTKDKGNIAQNTSLNNGTSTGKNITCAVSNKEKRDLLKSREPMPLPDVPVKNTSLNGGSSSEKNMTCAITSDVKRDSPKTRKPMPLPDVPAENTSLNGRTSSVKNATSAVSNGVKQDSLEFRKPMPLPLVSASIKNGDSNGSTQSLEMPFRPSFGSLTGTARQRVIKSGNMVSSIPEEEIAIPNDGNLASFSADDMATFLRYLKLEDRLVNHLHRKGLDGRKFGRLKDTDLDNLQLKNPVVVYFRDRTVPAVTKKQKPRLSFVL